MVTKDNHPPQVLVINKIIDMQQPYLYKILIFPISFKKFLYTNY